MKKVIIGVVVALIVIVGGFLAFHKSSNTTKTASTSPATTSSTNSPAVNNAVLITKTASGVGSYLADPSGNTLYTYNADSSGVSNCTGSCLAAWPAYQDKGSTANLPAGVSTFKRADNGQTQYTYNGMPLYYFVSDSQGKVSGNGVENFTVAKPTTASASTSTSTPSTSTSPTSTSPSYNY